MTGLTGYTEARRFQHAVRGRCKATAEGQRLLMAQNTVQQRGLTAKSKQHWRGGVTGTKGYEAASMMGASAHTSQAGEAAALVDAPP